MEEVPEGLNRVTSVEEEELERMMASMQVVRKSIAVMSPIVEKENVREQTTQLTL